MTLTCLECKNTIDLSAYSDLKEDTVVECGTCGITLAVVSIGEDGTVEVEVVDEGK